MMAMAALYGLRQQHDLLWYTRPRPPYLMAMAALYRPKAALCDGCAHLGSLSLLSMAALTLASYSIQGHICLMCSRQPHMCSGLLCDGHGHLTFAQGGLSLVATVTPLGSHMSKVASDTI